MNPLAEGTTVTVAYTGTTGVRIVTGVVVRDPQGTGLLRLAVGHGSNRRALDIAPSRITRVTVHALPAAAAETRRAAALALRAAAARLDVNDIQGTRRHLAAAAATVPALGAPR